jgi:hypothetical protein
MQNFGDIAQAINKAKKEAVREEVVVNNEALEKWGIKPISGALEDKDCPYMLTDILTGEFRGIEYKGRMLVGSFGYDEYGNWGLTDGFIRERISDPSGLFDTYEQFQRIENGLQTFAEIKDLDGNTLLIISPKEENGYNVYDSFGEYYLGTRIHDNTTDYRYILEDGEIKRIEADLYSVNIDSEENIASFEFLTGEKLDEYYESILDKEGKNRELTQEESEAIDKIANAITEPQEIEEPETTKQIKSLEELDEQLKLMDDPTIDPNAKQTILDEISRLMNEVPYELRPNVDLVLRKEDVFKLDLGVVKYESSNDAIVSIRGGNSDLPKIVLDPRDAINPIKEIKLKENLYVNETDDYKTTWGCKVAFGDRIGMLLGPLGHYLNDPKVKVEVEYQYDQKLEGEIVGTFKASFGRNSSGNTVFSYKNRIDSAVGDIHAKVGPSVNVTINDELLRDTGRAVVLSLFLLLSAPEGLPLAARAGGSSILV